MLQGIQTSVKMFQKQHVETGKNTAAYFYRK